MPNLNWSPKAKGCMSSFLRKTKHSGKADKRRFMMRNGEILLEKLIKSCNNRCNPIRCFSAEELKRATNNYDRQQVITTGIGSKLYKGFLRDHSVFVMKFVDYDYAKEGCFNNLVFASQMRHKNVLRLIGCCLETQTPTLVFEFIEYYGTLADRIYPHCQRDFEPLPWTQRLSIAMEIANAIAYPHVGFSRPIVFRMLEPSSILLHEQNAAELYDFSYSEYIPVGETHIKDKVVGTFGYLPFEYMATGACNEKCDVYTFGVLLLVLLTGQRAVDRSRRELSLGDHVKKYFENNRFNDTIDPIIVGEGLCSTKERKLQAVAGLAFNCLSVIEEDRPTMVDVAKQLRQILRSE